MLTRSSSVKSLIATQRRRISAPLSLMTSCGAMTLPSDFDILRPSRSIRKPCVSTSRYGGRPRVASATSSELWNQPRCWSLPSRYMSAGHVSSGAARQHRLVARARVEPDVEDVALALERRPAARRAGQARRAGTPRSAARTRRRRRTARRPPRPGRSAPRVSTASPQRGAVERRDRHAPRALARDAPVGAVRHHVEDAIVAPRRDPRHLVVDGVPRGVAQRPRLAVLALRSPASPSMRTNHCDVARKITGLWQRQQCGYWCENVCAVPQPAALVQRLPRPSGWRRRRAGRRTVRRCRGSGRPDRPARRSRARTSRRSGSRPRRDRARCARRRCPASSVT